MKIRKLKRRLYNRIHWTIPYKEYGVCLLTNKVQYERTIGKPTAYRIIQSIDNICRTLNIGDTYVNGMYGIFAIEVNMSAYSWPTYSLNN